MVKGIGIVHTKFGKISGVEAEEDKYLGITYFKGIPYATPPVGELRFKPPVDLKAWDGVKSCDTYAARAMQPDMGGLAAEPYASDFYWMGTPPVSEDCLYLNVTTGAKDEIGRAHV